MKNNFYKIFPIFVISLVLQSQVFAVGENSLPVSTSYSEAIQSAQQTTQVQNTQEQNTEQTLANQAVNGTLNNNGETLQENNKEEVKPIAREIREQTKPKRSYVNVVFKFILAMLWVCISSVFIFIMLLSYKKLILKGKPVTPTYESKEQTLDTPKNFKEAIKIFLDKTKWN